MYRARVETLGILIALRYPKTPLSSNPTPHMYKSITTYRTKPLLYIWMPYNKCPYVDLYNSFVNHVIAVLDTNPC